MEDKDCLELRPILANGAMIGCCTGVHCPDDDGLSYQDCQCSKLKVDKLIHTHQYGLHSSLKMPAMFKLGTDICMYTVQRYTFKHTDLFVIIGGFTVNVLEAASTTVFIFILDNFLKWLLSCFGKSHHFCFCFASAMLSMSVGLSNMS